MTGDRAPSGPALTYDGQLELEFTCVCCHQNTYPKRLTGGYCRDCAAGGLTDDELIAEAQEYVQRASLHACTECDRTFTAPCEVCGDLICDTHQHHLDGDGPFCQECHADLLDNARREVESERMAL